jgi:protein-S-isoprenylcysteine O-methyltransferase Ste14
VSVLPILLLITIPVNASALWYARVEYRQKGRLSWLGVSLLCLMFFMPNLMMDYATNYRWPSTPFEYAGLVIACLGLVLCMAGIAHFRSFSKTFCTEPGELTLTGPYRWGRNPQYLGWFLFILGFGMTDWSEWCIVVLIILGASIHLLILIEEEHLHRVFGARYDEFWRRVPRYIGKARQDG